WATAAGRGLAARLRRAPQGPAGGEVRLMAGGDHPEGLPPPYLLPGEVEYQTVPGLQIADFKLQNEPTGQQSAIYNLQSAITWADQIFAALPPDQLLALREAIRRV